MWTFIDSATRLYRGSDRPGQHRPVSTVRIRSGHRSHMNQPPLILASASPRRHAILMQFAIHHIVVPSAVREPEPFCAEPPDQFACRAAAIKAQDV
ncbi:Maf family protein, partial [bacterium]|nr:Maf family protein [candidate division CSSED10-310 bacterium]